MKAIGFLKKLFGGDTQTVGETKGDKAPTGVPFSFGGENYTDLALLGRALRSRPEEALEQLKSGGLAEWVINHARKPKLGNALEEVADDHTLCDVTKIAVLEVALDPAVPPKWEGEELSAQWPTQNSQKTLSVVQKGYAYWTDRLRKTEWFKTLIPPETKVRVAGRECTFRAVPWTGIQLCTTIVTRGQWKEFVKQTGWNKSREWECPSFDQTDDHPAVNVSWEDANEFCEWISKGEGKRFRLPSDGEWTKAAGDTKYPWGDHHPPTAKDGIYSVPVERAGTAPVATCRPNFLGLYDMGGNVWEWSLDAPASEPSFRVLRGASWYHRQRGYLQSSRRPYASPEERGDNYGFRLALVVLGE